MRLTKEAKSFILEMVPDCIKSNNPIKWAGLEEDYLWSSSSHRVFSFILADCWNSLTQLDKSNIFKNSYIDTSYYLAESIFNSKNHENKLLNIILDFKGFKGRVWE